MPWAQFLGFEQSPSILESLAEAYDAVYSQTSPAAQLCHLRSVANAVHLGVDPVASKIPILLIRLGQKRLDSGLAILRFGDADSSRPVPLLADLRGRMDEPTSSSSLLTTCAKRIEF